MRFGKRLFDTFAHGSAHLVLKVAFPGLLLLSAVAHATGLHSIDVLGSQTLLQNVAMLAAVAVVGSALGSPCMAGRA